MYVYVCERERVGKCLGMREREYVRVCVCVYERKRKKERVFVCVCVCVFMRERERKRERDRQTDRWIEMPTIPTVSVQMFLLYIIFRCMTGS